MPMIFFDLDDTLFDHGRASLAGAKGFYQEHSKTLALSYTEFFRLWKQAGKLHIDRYFRNEISYQEQRRSRVRDVFAPSGRLLSDEDADRCFSVYLRHYEAAWRLFGDVLPCIETLKEYRRGIISNGDVKQQTRKLVRTGLPGYFETVLFSGELGIAKPRPAIFAEAARRAGVETADCIYIGDRPDTDAAAALNAGMKGVWLNRTGAGVEDLPVSSISSLSELPALLEQL